MKGRPWLQESSPSGLKIWKKTSVYSRGPQPSLATTKATLLQKAVYKAPEMGEGHCTDHVNCLPVSQFLDLEVEFPNR